jgi:uncharacterized surface protein with fasciclin (FAS1) repeats
MTVRRFMVGAAVATLAVVTAACGDDDDAAQEDVPAAEDIGSGTESDSSSDTTTESEPSTAEIPATVVDVAASDQNFSTLVTAVQTAGLAETLSGEGPFTVFAPVNDAFAALPQGTVDTLLQPANREQLTSVLTYHVVPAKALLGDLSDGMTVTTVQGQPLTVNVTGAAVTLTDGSGNTVSVVQPDIEAGNGVVHVIDGVLLPAAS